MKEKAAAGAGQISAGAKEQERGGSNIATKNINNRFMTQQMCRYCAIANLQNRKCASDFGEYGCASTHSGTSDRGVLIVR